MRTNPRHPFSLFILLLSLCLFVQGWQAAAQSEREGSLSLTLSPEDPSAWRTWRPVYNTEVTFVATLSGTDATQSLSDVTYTLLMDGTLTRHRTITPGLTPKPVSPATPSSATVSPCLRNTAAL